MQQLKQVFYNIFIPLKFTFYKTSENFRQKKAFFSFTNRYKIVQYFHHPYYSYREKHYWKKKLNSHTLKESLLLKVFIYSIWFPINGTSLKDQIKFALGHLKTDEMFYLIIDMFHYKSTIFYYSIILEMFCFLGFFLLISRSRAISKKTNPSPNILLFKKLL